MYRERQTDRQRQRDRGRDRERQRQRHRERERNKDRDRETETEVERERHIHAETETQRDRDTKRESERRELEGGREGERGEIVVNINISVKTRQNHVKNKYITQAFVSTVLANSFSFFSLRPAFLFLHKEPQTTLTVIHSDQGVNVPCQRPI